MNHIDHTIANPFGGTITLRLYEDGRLAIAGMTEWQGVKQRGWIPLPHMMHLASAVQGEEA